MKPLERIEALLSTLNQQPRTKYGLYRAISGSAYRSLKRAIQECIDKGLIESHSEVRYGAEIRVYKITEKGRKMLQALRA